MSGGPRVAIVGGGVGGLALAQGLRTAGVDVRVYERDPSARHRRQGYRIHISAVGEEALAEVLPARVHRRVVETATHPGDLVAGFDSRLTPLFEQTFPVTDPQAVTAVDRDAFRRALTTGIEDVLHFGYEFESYADTGDGRVEVRFTDGRRITADVLVGADGVGSRVRAQLLPRFTVVDIGVRCVYGKLPLTDAVRDRVPPEFLRGFCFVTDDRGRGAGFAPVLFREPPEDDGDYLMTVVTGTAGSLGRTDDELFALSTHDLWDVAIEATADWHPALREIVAAADPGAAFPITLRSCTGIDPWPTTRVTLLGDAIHPMTPAAGAGANTALRDAARLTRALADSPADTASTVASLAAYERDMIGYGTEAAGESLRNAEQMFGVRAPVS